MTYAEYKAWDGTFEWSEYDGAEARERAGLKKMTKEEFNKYFDLCEIYVYEQKCEKELFDLCERFGFTLRDAMIVY